MLEKEDTVKDSIIINENNISMLLNVKFKSIEK